MGERLIPEDLALKIVRIWLETRFRWRPARKTRGDVERDVTGR